MEVRSVEYVIEEKMKRKYVSVCQELGKGPAAFTVFHLNNQVYIAKCYATGTPSQVLCPL